MAWPKVVAIHWRKQQKVTVVVDDASAHPPPESLALQDRKDEPVIVIVPSIVDEMAPPVVAERPLKMPSITVPEPQVNERWSL
jgi:hypothetical protein